MVGNDNVHTLFDVSTVISFVVPFIVVIPPDCEINSKPLFVTPNTCPLVPNVFGITTVPHPKRFDALIVVVDIACDKFINTLPLVSVIDRLPSLLVISLIEPPPPPVVQIKLLLLSKLIICPSVPETSGN